VAGEGRRSEGCRGAKHACYLMAKLVLKGVVAGQHLNWQCNSGEATK
jgi:hypothetical protein